MYDVRFYNSFFAAYIPNEHTIILHSTVQSTRSSEIRNSCLMNYSTKPLQKLHFCELFRRFQAGQGKMGLGT